MAIMNPYITSSLDLVTSREARRDGFLAIALRRDIESIPYLDQSKALWVKLNAHTKRCEDILKLKDLNQTLLLAAGYSIKAQWNMDEEDKTRLLEEFVVQVLKPSGKKYVNEIVYRYLLSLGEQLGGRMRNIIGIMAREKLSRNIIAQLRVNDFPFSINCGNRWINGNKCSTREEHAAKAIRWQNGEYQRMLVHNLVIPNVSKNVDFVVFNKFADTIDKKGLTSILNDFKTYIAMGELKGGIDPAGADEHWKTARAALDRIRSTFKKTYIAFIGAAIEKAMAAEIFVQLQNGDLDNAANLTNENQISSLCDWLVNL